MTGQFVRCVEIRMLRAGERDCKQNVDKFVHKMSVETEICYNTTLMKKVIITVVGKDTVGILAKTCTYLSKHDINILDISQTVVSGYFNMMMIVDGAKSDRSFDKLNEDMNKIGESMGLTIRCQKSEIFEKMHRV